MSNNYHVPVLLNSVVEGLNINPKGIYVDVTYGGGGHSKAILDSLTTGKLIAFDQDEEALKNDINDENLILVNANFCYLKNFVKLHGYDQVDGIIADLGVSSYQIDTPERGFSIRYDSALDLRMNQKQEFSAQDIVNKYDKDNLVRVIKLYGELPASGKIADSIIEKRQEKLIVTTGDLKAAVSRYADKNTPNKFYARLFQALRIEVNKELDYLKDFLTQSVQLLKSGGRIVIISYHSLEDRLVKNFFKAGNFEGDVLTDFYGNRSTPFNLITRKPLMAGSEELKENKRARSAKLRIAEKI